MTSFFIGFVLGYVIASVVTFTVFHNAILRHNARVEQKQ